MTSWTLRGTGHVTLRAEDDVILPDLGMKTVSKFVENIVKSIYSTCLDRI